VGKRTVPAVYQVGKVLSYLAKGPNFKVRLSDIARDLNLHKSRVYYILNTLREFGLVEKDPYTKTYSLGPALIFMGEKVLENLDYRRKAEPFLKELARMTGCTAFLGKVLEGRIYVVAKEYADDGVKITIPLGYRFPLSYGALGKIMLAFGDEKGRNDLLTDERLRHWAERVNLEEELFRFRTEGYAEDIREMDPRFSSVASPVLEPTQKVFGMVFIVGTFDEFTARLYGPQVASTAKELSKVICGSF
jgi:DNA-binding IclR family transcriptional regulator